MEDFVQYTTYIKMYYFFSNARDCFYFKFEREQATIPTATLDTFVNVL